MIRGIFGILVIVNVNDDKSCDVGKYLDYKNFKCSIKLVDKLAEECSETVEEVKIARKNMHKNKCSSCTVYISIRQTIVNINGRSQTNKYQKLNLLFLQRHDQSQRFWFKLVKNR